MGWGEVINTPTGWKCPECGQVWAPTVEKCSRCGPKRPGGRLVNPPIRLSERSTPPPVTFS